MAALYLQVKNLHLKIIGSRATEDDFLIRCFFKKDWNWAGQLWFIFAFLFWVTSMISGILGPYDKYSFFQGFIWIRFPLYVAAAQIWLGQDRDIRMVMFTSMVKSMGNLIVTGQFNSSFNG